MLKNKFGMLKVLALALSMLMLVSLVACGNDGMSDEEIQSMADTYTEGYRIGFVMTGKDLSKKKTVELR